MLAAHPIHMKEVLNRFRDAGYEIWLDDFGSGYSSLNILKDYPVDLIKLDLAFLRSQSPGFRYYQPCGAHGQDDGNPYPL